MTADALKKCRPRWESRSRMTTSAVLVMLAAAPIMTVLGLEKSWTLYHSLNGGQDFARRASIVLSVDPDTDTVDMSITNDNSTLTKEAYLAAKAPGSMYQLKLVGEDPNNFLLASVPGCQLLRANFREEIVLTLGPKASAISLTYIPLVSPLAPKSCDHEVYDNKLANGNYLPDGWDSRVSWETATPGMTLKPVLPQYRPPPGLKWLPRLGATGKLYQAQGPPGTGGGEGGDKNQQEQQPVDNSPMGFIRRYWYLLLPLFLSNFIGGEPPPPAEGQQPQGEGGAAQVGGGGAPAQGGAAPSASPGGGGGGAKQRRGKRG